MTKKTRIVQLVDVNDGSRLLALDSEGNIWGADWDDGELVGWKYLEIPAALDEC